MKRTSAALAVLIVLGALASCRPAPSPAPAAEEAFIQTIVGTQAQKLSEYDSPYTMCYQNQDGSCDFYVFSSPVQYKSGSSFVFFQGEMQESKEKDYAYEHRFLHTSLLFPKRLTQPFRLTNGRQSLEFTLSHADSAFAPAVRERYRTESGLTVDAVVYKSKALDVYCYATATGLGLEYRVKERLDDGIINLEVQNLPKSETVSQVHDYVLISKEKDIKALFYASLSAVQGRASRNTITLLESSSIPGKVRMQLRFSEEACAAGAFTASSSVEFYVNKMPDSTACKTRTPPASYLSNYSMAGEDKQYATACHYLRMRVKYFLEANADTVRSAGYYIKPLCAIEEAELEGIRLHEVTSQWSSMWLSWEGKGAIGDKISSLRPAGGNAGYYTFDVTRFIRKCLEDQQWMTESYGAVICNENDGGCAYFASSDHSLYPPYIKIQFSRKPDRFHYNDKINDVPEGVQ